MSTQPTEKPAGPLWRGARADSRRTMQRTVPEDRRGGTVPAGVAQALRLRLRFAPPSTAPLEANAQLDLHGLAPLYVPPEANAPPLRLCGLTPETWSSLLLPSTHPDCRREIRLRLRLSPAQTGSIRAIDRTVRAELHRLGPHLFLDPPTALEMEDVYEPLVEGSEAEEAQYLSLHFAGPAHRQLAPSRIFAEGKRDAASAADAVALIEEVVSGRGGVRAQVQIAAPWVRRCARRCTARAICTSLTVAPLPSRRGGHEDELAKPDAGPCPQSSLLHEGADTV